MASLHITKAQDGQVIAAKVGDSIELELPGNPTTGYKWSFAALDRDRIAVEGSDYQPSGGAVGSGGVEKWTLSARAAGTAKIELKRSRSWEGEASSIERFKVTLDVKAA